MKYGFILGQLCGFCTAVLGYYSGKIIRRIVSCRGAGRTGGKDYAGTKTCHVNTKGLSGGRVRFEVDSETALLFADCLEAASKRGTYYAQTRRDGERWRGC